MSNPPVDTVTQADVTGDSEKDLINALPGNKKEMAEKYLNSIKDLKAIAVILHSQKKLYQQRLIQALTPNELNILEEEILAQDKAISAMYTSMVSPLQDEETAAILRDYLSTNLPLLAILKVFEFQETLLDDIFAAKTRITTNTSNQSSDPV